MHPRPLPLGRQAAAGFLIGQSRSRPRRAAWLCRTDSPAGLVAVARAQVPADRARWGRLNGMDTGARYQAVVVGASLGGTEALQTILLLGPAIDRAGLELRVDCPPLDRAVQLDPAMWETVALNLVSNAVKHTFTGAITVALRQRPGHVELSVTDTGTGIPKPTSRTCSPGSTGSRGCGPAATKGPASAWPSCGRSSACTTAVSASAAPPALAAPSPSGCLQPVPAAALSPRPRPGRRQHSQHSQAFPAGLRRRRPALARRRCRPGVRARRAAAPARTTGQTPGSTRRRRQP
jgi:hypothetical protein